MQHIQQVLKQCHFIQHCFIIMWYKYHTLTDCATGAPCSIIILMRKKLILGRGHCMRGVCKVEVEAGEDLPHGGKGITFHLHFCPAVVDRKMRGLEPSSICSPLSRILVFKAQKILRLA